MGLFDVYTSRGLLEPEYVVTVEDSYLTHQMDGVWTARMLYAYLLTKCKPGEEIEILTPILWMHLDVDGSLIKTFNLYRIGSA